jgi:uncharacterized protein YaaR (DUF327 family)
VLTVSTDAPTWDEIIKVVEKAGYKAEKLSYARLLKPGRVFVSKRYQDQKLKSKSNKTMKTFLPSIAIALALLTACNSNEKETSVSTIQAHDSSQVATDTSNRLHGQPAVTESLVKHYLEVNNALTNDNGPDAAAAAREMVDVIENTGGEVFSADQKKVYDDVKDDIKEHAKHISSQGVKIEHQREHFDMLSTDMYDLVKVFKPMQTLYFTHCPMFNDNKGANWLSEVKEISNPYYGKKMRDCGVVKEEINP